MQPAAPLPLAPEPLSRAADTLWVGRHIEVHERLSSTMDRAAELTGPGSHGTVIVAHEQSAGRGRRGRDWISSRGRGLYFSVVLEPKGSARELGALSPATGLAVRTALTSVCGKPVGLKWPNDVRVGGKKIAGVLAAAEAGSGNVGRIVVGVGVNLRHDLEDFPPDLRESATSLRMVSGRDLDPGRVLVCLLESLETTWDRFFAEGFDALVADWNRACDHLNQTVTVGGRTGRTVGIDPSGGLVVEGGDGKRFQVASGEIE